LKVFVDKVVDIVDNVYKLEQSRGLYNTNGCYLLWINC